MSCLKWRAEPVECAVSRCYRWKWWNTLQPFPMRPHLSKESLSLAGRSSPASICGYDLDFPESRQNHGLECWWSVRRTERQDCWSTAYASLSPYRKVRFDLRAMQTPLTDSWKALRCWVNASF